MAALLLYAAALIVCCGAKTARADLSCVWDPNDVHYARLKIEGALSDEDDYNAFHWPVGTNGVVSKSYANTKVTGPSEGKWKADVRVSFVKYYSASDELLGSTFALSVDGKHMVKGEIGSGHERESEIVTPDLHVYARNLLGITSTDDDVNTDLGRNRYVDQETHLLGGHLDTIRLVVKDLNGVAPGMLGPGHQLSAVAILTHPIPEPSTGVLLCLAAAAATVRRRAALRHRR